VVLKGGKLYEARVDLAANSLVSWHEIANRQAGLTVEEMMHAADLPKKDPRWQAALAKRGITSYDKIECFPLAAGPVDFDWGTCRRSTFHLGSRPRPRGCNP
jgi:primary-amine oxidase